MKELQDEIDRLKKLARLAPNDEYQSGYLRALTNVSAIIDEMQTKQKLNIHGVSGSVAFAKWIGERMNVDSWFRYDARFGIWYWHMKGHLTTKELYEVFVATDR